MILKIKLITRTTMGDRDMVLGENQESLMIFDEVVPIIGELSQVIDGDGPRQSLYHDQNHELSHFRDQEYGQHLIHEVFLQILKRIKTFRIWS